jgi:hypothetical protein
VAIKGWKPLVERESGAEESLYDGVPSHIERPILDWLRSWASHDILTAVCMRVRVPYACTVRPEDSYYREQALLGGLQTTGNAPKALLSVVEGVLYARVHEEPSYRGAKNYGKRAIDSLSEILDFGGSKWRVEGDHLEARVDDAVRAAVEKARHESKATSASEHLGNAWLALYGRNPNPAHAYAEAIKAVEASAAPVVTPNDMKAQLGKIRGELDAHAPVWRFSIAPRDISAVTSAMTTLEQGQTDRHGGNLPTQTIDPRAAEAAVLLAATLVHWFATGAVQRR